MKYLVLIYTNEATEAALSKQAQGALMEEYFKYTEDAQKAGVLLASEALMPTNTATTLRSRDGKVTHTDGPFAETKEQLGGFYLLEVPDADEAFKWAARIPTVRTGSIEVRPCVKFG